MKSERYVFPPFVVDTREGSFRRDSQEIELRPKTFAVLCYLLERAGELVSKDELLEHVWAGTYVDEGALTVCITELRKALGDDTKKPRFIVTVTKRGYLFIADVRSSESSVQSQEENQKSKDKSDEETRGLRLETSSSPPPASSLKPLASPFVGRDTDLAHLHSLFAKACDGQRQLVFVTGEPGIGKSTLVEAFRQRLEAGDWRLVPSPHASSLRPLASPVSFAHGQCIEHYGAGEAYLPILDALGQLCCASGGEQLIELLNQHAPSWLVQMPALLNATDMEALQRRVAGATRERMLREMTGALEVLTAESTLILILEDLHWSDYSTLDLLSFIARRQSPARLMVIGTYRPGDVLRHEHPLHTVKQELQLHSQCEELNLHALTTEDVGAYLARQFPDSSLPTELKAVVHQRTEGNPLFMVTVVNDFVTQGVIAQREGQWEIVDAIEKQAIPSGLGQFIEQQIARINPEGRALLEAASVVGMDFSVAAVTAALGKGIAEVETLCEGLARRSQFVQSNGVSTWPDGTVAARYRFLHALYQEVLFERISAGRRVHLHRQIGERIEAAYGKRAREVATELAVHFEQGQDVQRAVQYLGQAGENAIRQNAHVEAITLLNHAIELLQTLPDSPERAQQELGLYLLLRTPLATTKGYVAPEVEHAYMRAYELCKHVGQAPQLFIVLGGPYALHFLRAELPKAYQVAEERMRLAESLPFDLFLLSAHTCLGQPLLFMGEFPRARVHLEQSFMLYKPQQLGAFGYLYDPGVMTLSLLAFALWLLGYPDQALKRSQETLALARELSHPYSLAYALIWATRVHGLRGELQVAQRLEEELIALCTENGFAYFLAIGTISQGWSLVEQERSEEGILKIRQGLNACQATGEKLGLSTYLILLADTYGKGGNITEGKNTFTEAEEFIRTTEERFWEAELYRLKGELTLQEANQKSKGKSRKEARGLWLGASSLSPQDPSLTPLAPSGVEREAEECFLKAIAIAQQQHAKSFELRATMSLARLWQHQGKAREAHQMLSELYAWFTEGFDTKDLQEAKALLNILSQESGVEIPLPEIAQQEMPVPNLRLVVNKDNPAQRPPRMPIAKRGRR